MEKAQVWLSGALLTPVIKGIPESGATSSVCILTLSSTLAAIAPGCCIPCTVRVCVSNAHTAFLPHCCQV